MVGALSCFLLCTFFFPTIIANSKPPIKVSNDLDYFYDTLSAKHTSSHGSSEEVNPLYHILGDKLKYEASVRPEDINQIYQLMNKNVDANLVNDKSHGSSGEVNPLYHILGDKLKYEASVRPEDINQLYQLMNKNADANLVNGNLLFPHTNLDFVNLTIFHRYEDLKIGNRMPLFFTNQGPKSSKLVKELHPKVVSPYASNPQLCEKPMATGEQRSCVESLEEMMNFVVGLMGKNVKPISTPPGKWQMYTVAGPARTIRDQVTGCHKQDYLPFAVYGCHYIPRSQVRVVPLVGDDGTKLEALSVCHMDTSSWNGHHLLFMLLKAKPGPPVCHFLATDDIMWVTK